MRGCSRLASTLRDPGDQRFTRPQRRTTDSHVWPREPAGAALALDEATGDSKRDGHLIEEVGQAGYGGRYLGPPGLARGLEIGHGGLVQAVAGQWSTSRPATSWRG